MVIDFHTHAFPDALAPKAIESLETLYKEKSYQDGTISGLIASMDRAGIDKAVICSIATKPTQFEAILEWSRAIRSDRIIPLLSLHPEMTGIPEKIRIIKQEGFAGIKLHPYFQEFRLDDENIYPIYENLEKQELLLVSHMGFDFAFPPERISDPQMVPLIKQRFPDLKFVASHFGGWNDWDEVEKHLIGKKYYIEISYALHMIGTERARSFIANHPAGYLMFGTDAPWIEQTRYRELFRELNLPQETEKAILGENAVKLLQSTGARI